MRMLENESHYYSILEDGSHKPGRQRNPFCLSLREVCQDEGTAKKFAVRQINGIRPTLSDKPELLTGRKCEMTLDLMRETSNLLESEIPLLKQQVQSTHERISKLERRQQRRAKSALGSRAPLLSGRSNREMYTPSGTQPLGRVQSAMSHRSDALSEAQSALGKAQETLRPQTAKTTKTQLSHRLRNGWSGTLRQGEIKRLAGKGIPKRVLPWQSTDISTGVVRHRPGRPRTAEARTLQNSCRRAPGYRAPDLDIIEGGADPYCNQPTGSPVSAASMQLDQNGQPMRC